MDVNDVKGVYGEVKKRMDAVLEHLKRELGGVRTGRASVTLLDPGHVAAYGTLVPLNQVAALSIPEPTLIVAETMARFTGIPDAGGTPIEAGGGDDAGSEEQPPLERGVCGSPALVR